ncbi:SDR family NAD(P)-dependent oxidoreductase [Sphingobium tyrosinilyticum]|uniref:SDR family NAD(P)-dependent oxidoreductase n=1 Tax=Sphingobium tyrosinilyticum TaxID=2715436 RepID=A0ABV9EZG2_9SPHN
MRFDGQAAVITGAGAGLGRAYALFLASRGARVLVNNRAGMSSPEKVVEEIRAAGGEAVADCHDAANEAASIVKAAVDAFGQIDIVIANAGIALTGPVATTPLDQWRQTMEVTFFGAVDLLKHAWSELAKTRGRVITTSSSSIFGQERTAPYSAPKAAILALTRAAALEGRAAGIRVNAILPVAFTKMNAGITDPVFLAQLRDNFLPEQVAAAVGWLAHESVSVTGEAFSIGGGRIARVFTGVSRGWGKGHLAPEDFVGHLEDILDLEDFRAPANSGEEVIFAGEQLGLSLASRYTDMGRSASSRTWPGEQIAEEMK